jgi:uncharacterized protein YgbK (DUF1537 family)
MSATGSEVRFCVIADDLTGAMDTGVGLAQAGLSAIITFSAATRVVSDAVVATTDSRAESATEAYRRVKAVADRFRDHYIYKKIDSTLRGNIAAELQAVLDVTRAEHAVVCPAFPSIRRTVVNGMLLVDGVPVHETGFARDPVSPVTRSDIAEVLRAGSGIAAENITVADVQQGASHLADRIQACASRAVVIDAYEDKHLRTIAEALVLGRNHWVPCGSGGLGAQIPLAFGFSTCTDSIPPAPKGPALLAVGSRNEVTVRQLQRVIAITKPPVVSLEPRHFRTKIGRGPRINQVAHDVQQMLEERGIVILTSSLGDYAPQMRHTMAPVLGAIVTRVLERGTLAGLFLCGGDVARAVCGDEGIQALRILGDLQPGVIVGEVAGDRYQGLRVVTKAGGFGNEDAIADVVRHFTQGG